MLSLSTLGLFLYFIYPILLIATGIYLALTRETTVESFFLANRNVSWYVVSISLLISSLFGPYSVGLLLSTSQWGLPFYYGIISFIMLLILGWFVTPIYLDKKISTLSEYFEKRFNKYCGYYVASLYVISNVLIRLLIVLVAGNYLMSYITGFQSFFLIFFLLAVTGIYVIIGGLGAELYSNLIQLSVIVFFLIGLTGWLIFNNDGHTVSSVSSQANNLIAKIDIDFSVPKLMIGIPVIGFWFWCADQFVIQKVSSAKNLVSVKKASVITGIVPIGILTLSFFFTSILFPNFSFSNSADSLLSGGITLFGVKECLILIISSALVATFAGIFNSTSIVFTFDLYKKLKPHSSDREIVLAGRMTIFALIICAFLLLAISSSLSQHVILSIFNLFIYLITLVGTLFFVGLISKEVSSYPILLTIAIVTFIILARTILELFYFSYEFENVFAEWYSGVESIEFSLYVSGTTILLIYAFHYLRQIISPILNLFYKMVSSVYAVNSSKTYKTVFFC